jgi:hypothetical protein
MTAPYRPNVDETLLLFTLKSQGHMEITSDAKRAFWTRMADMGFAKITDHAPGGFERRKDHFVVITAAGLTLLEELA